MKKTVCLVLLCYLPRGGARFRCRFAARVCERAFYAAVLEAREEWLGLEREHIKRFKARAFVSFVLPQIIRERVQWCSETLLGERLTLTCGWTGKNQMWRWLMKDHTDGWAYCVGAKFSMKSYHLTL